MTARKCKPVTHTKWVRIDAVLVLTCATRAGKRACGITARYVHNDPHKAYALARADGWGVLGMTARCPACGRRGQPFGEGGADPC